MIIICNFLINGIAEEVRVGKFILIMIFATAHKPDLFMRLCCYFVDLLEGVCDIPVEKEQYCDDGRLGDLLSAIIYPERTFACSVLLITQDFGKNISTYHLIVIITVNRSRFFRVQLKRLNVVLNNVMVSTC